MKEERKTNSFLFNLFQKHKNHEDLTQEFQPKKVNTEQMDSEKPDSSPIVSEEKVTETASSLLPDQKAAPVPSKLPKEKLYLEPLFELYYFISHSITDDTLIADLLSFETWMLSPVSALPFYADYEKEIIEFTKDMCREADALLHRISKEEAAYETNMQQYTEALKIQSDNPEHPIKVTQPAALPPIHVSLRVKTSRDKMYAFLFALPPYRDGNGLTEDDIIKTLKMNGINFGIDEPLIEKIAAGTPYMQLYLIAQGTFPIHGKDGIIIDKINYSSEIEILEDEKGSADFKNLNLIHSVLKDQVLCEIIPPEEGTPGTDVSKMIVNARIGKTPSVPNGRNTAISEDGTKLLSLIDGQILFQGGRFNVEPVLIVKDNVDYGVGNIDFPGDVVVYGDVCNGFSIKACGSVTVRGMVEDASITAGGDVIINKGMNGNHSGSIDAKGMIKTSFLENCTIYAEGCIYANSIVACSIFCDDTVFVQGSKGVIIGGQITAYRSVEARMIGSKSCRETTITLGEMPRLYTKKCSLQDELKETDSIIEKLDMNVSYLDRFKETLPPEKLDILTQLQQQRSLYQQKRTELRAALSQLSNDTIDFSECRIKCTMIFPPTKIVIGSNSYTVATVSSKCNIFWTEEGIEVGILS